jgi:hypothetical protein
VPSTFALVLAAFLSSSADAPATRPLPTEAARIEFRDLVAPDARLAPSSKARALQGKRVRLVGFMAQMEEPPRGAFYLASHPVRCDEGGAGTGDLPPDAVRVVVRNAASEEVPFYPGRIEVSGVLAIGNEVDDAGRTSFFRLVLDRPEDIGKVAAPSPVP